jgi:hypothetical protein
MFGEGWDKAPATFSNATASLDDDKKATQHHNERIEDS